MDDFTSVHSIDPTSLFFTTMTQSNTMNTDFITTASTSTYTNYSSSSTFMESTSMPPTVPVLEGEPIYPYNMLGFTAASAFVIAIFGSFGNLLTIIALPMTKKLRTTATAFVVNLAVVELLFCVVILPMSGSQYLYLQKHSTSLLTDQDCIFFTALRYALTQAELQTILAIAVTRALAVATPRMYSFINKSSVIGTYIALIWIYSIALKIPPVLGTLGKYGFNERTMECDLKPDKSPKARLILILVEAVIPVLLIFILYIFVFIMVVRRAVIRQRKFSHTFPPLQQQVKRSSARVARASRRAGGGSKVAPPTSSSTSTGTTENGRKGSTTSFKSLKKMVSESSLRTRFRRQSSTISQRMGTSRRDLRVARTIFIIFLLVLVCSVPVMMIHFIDRNAKQPTRFLLLHILYWVQYCLNLVVYVLMNRQYRDAYVDCLARVFPRFQYQRGRRFFWEKASVSSRPAPNPSTKPPAGASNNQYQDSSVNEDDQGTADGPVPATMPQGRLNTIPEGHSSSAASDSVFADPAKKHDSREASKKERNLERKDNIDEEESRHSEERSRSEERSGDEEEVEENQALMDKEHWVTQNGATGASLPDSESKV